VKFRNKEQYIKTHPHHLHPNQTHGMQAQIRKQKKMKKEDAKRSFQRSLCVTSSVTNIARNVVTMHIFIFHSLRNTPICTVRDYNLTNMPKKKT
jgi:hypothetical protein